MRFDKSAGMPTMNASAETSPPTADTIGCALREAIEQRPALAKACRALAIELHPDLVVLDGSVTSIAAKRRLVLLAAQRGAGLGVCDRVKVEAVEPRNDAVIAAGFLDAVAGEPNFSGYRVLALADDTTPVAGETMDTDAENDDGDALETDRLRQANVIGASVTGATVRLEGRVASLTHRRLAEVLAWWIPGTTDVDNRLYVTPPEKDTDQEISDAVHMALEKDPRLDAENLNVRTRAREVRLAGALPSNEQRHMAECDAWYVRGVHTVTNDIVVAR